MNDKTIKEVYNVKELEGDEYSLVTWHNEVINKRIITELTPAGVARMLRQGVFYDIAIDTALKMLDTDPFIGEMYTGELIASLLEVDEKKLINKKSEIEKIIAAAKKDVNSIPWGYPEERDEYLEIIERLNNIIW